MDTNKSNDNKEDNPMQMGGDLKSEGDINVIINVELSNDEVDKELKIL